MNPNADGGIQGPLDSSPMTRAQIGVICAAVLLSALDGFDVLGMAYVAPAISRDWGLDKAVLGFLLSTSLIGMAFGSLALSPLADIFGRGPMVFAGVSLMILGSFLSALSQSVPQLAAFRILTGIGIGVVVPLTTAIAERERSRLRRDLHDGGVHRRFGARQLCCGGSPSTFPVALRLCLRSSRRRSALARDRVRSS